MADNIKTYFNKKLLQDLHDQTSVKWTNGLLPMEYYEDLDIEIIYLASGDITSYKLVNMPTTYSEITTYTDISPNLFLEIMKARFPKEQPKALVEIPKFVADEIESLRDRTFSANIIRTILDKYYGNKYRDSCNKLDKWLGGKHNDVLAHAVVNGYTIEDEEKKYYIKVYGGMTIRLEKNFKNQRVIMQTLTETDCAYIHFTEEEIKEIDPALWGTGLIKEV